MGGLAAEAAGGDFKTGAVTAGLNEAAVIHLHSYAEMQPEKKRQLLIMNSQWLDVMAAAAIHWFCRATIGVLSLLALGGCQKIKSYCLHAGIVWKMYA